MAGALGRQGVLTDVSVGESNTAGESNTIALKMYNCPYHDLAIEHREICEMDQPDVAAGPGERKSRWMTA